MKKPASFVIYQAKSGAIQLRHDVDNETIWATQVQMAELFGVTPQSIARHISNIFSDKELKEMATSTVFVLVQTEGSRKVKRSIKMYNLEVIISVGYRINSKKGTKFRQWATETLKSHITDGYTINPKRIKKNSQAFLQAIDEIKQLLPSNYSSNTSEVVDLIKLYASTWLLLEAYDKSALPSSGANNKQVSFTVEELAKDIRKLKIDLQKRKKATDLFGQEKQAGSLAGIVGNVLQSFGDEDLYSTIEEKAAHLLYFMIKNHPFNDGNKRSGAFAFLWLLSRTGILNSAQITPEAITTLTLLIAESNPKDKKRVVGLVLLLLRKNRL